MRPMSVAPAEYCTSVQPFFPWPPLSTFQTDPLFLKLSSELRQDEDVLHCWLPDDNSFFNTVKYSRCNQSLLTCPGCLCIPICSFFLLYDAWEYTQNRTDTMLAATTNRIIHIHEIQVQGNSYYRLTEFDWRYVDVFPHLYMPSATIGAGSGVTIPNIVYTCCMLPCALHYFGEFGYNKADDTNIIVRDTRTEATLVTARDANRSNAFFDGHRSAPAIRAYIKNQKRVFLSRPMPCVEMQEKAGCPRSPRHLRRQSAWLTEAAGALGSINSASAGSSSINGGGTGESGGGGPGRAAAAGLPVAVAISSQPVALADMEGDTGSGDSPQQQQRLSSLSSETRPADAPWPPGSAVDQGPPSVSHEISRLNDLKNSGLLTEPEFQAAKTKLLARL